jgi:2-hydroxy-3-oxopropionate reductase
MTDETPCVGLIGAGQMGGPIAARLLQAGYRLAVFDINAEALKPLAAAGAVIANSALEVANQADTVLASLPRPQIVRETIIGSAGAIHGARLRQFVDLSTSGATLALELAQVLAARGIASLDAPVSGGPAGARSGRLTLMVSGPHPVFDAVQPILACLGRPIFVGDKPGSAQTLKLLNNLMSVTAIAITSEAMAMGVKAGLDPNLMLEVLNASSGRNSATEDKFPRHVLTRRFDFGFPLGHSLKDFRLCLEEARSLGVPLPTGSVVGQLLEIAHNSFGANADLTTLARLLEGWSGCEITAGPSARPPPS